MKSNAFVSPKIVISVSYCSILQVQARFFIGEGAYLEPVNGAAVDQGWEHSQSTSERISDGAHS